MHFIMLHRIAVFSHGGNSFTTLQVHLCEQHNTRCDMLLVWFGRCSGRRSIHLIENKAKRWYHFGFHYQLFTIITTSNGYKCEPDHFCDTFLHRWFIRVSFFSWLLRWSHIAVDDARAKPLSTYANRMARHWLGTRNHVWYLFVHRSVAQLMPEGLTNPFRQKPSQANEKKGLRRKGNKGKVMKHSGCSHHVSMCRMHMFSSPTKRIHVITDIHADVANNMHTGYWHTSIEDLMSVIMFTSCVDDSTCWFLSRSRHAWSHEKDPGHSM